MPTQQRMLQREEMSQEYGDDNSDIDSDTDSVKELNALSVPVNLMNIQQAKSTESEEQRIREYAFSLADTEGTFKVFDPFMSSRPEKLLYSDTEEDFDYVLVKSSKKICKKKKLNKKQYEERMPTPEYLMYDSEDSCSSTGSDFTIEPKNTNYISEEEFELCVHDEFSDELNSSEDEINSPPRLRKRKLENAKSKRLQQRIRIESDSDQSAIESDMESITDSGCGSYTSATPITRSKNKAAMGKKFIYKNIPKGKKMPIRSSIRNIKK